MLKALIIDYGKLCIRLETLKNVILLEDKEDIEYQLKKLKQFLKMNGDKESFQTTNNSARVENARSQPTVAMTMFHIWEK